MFCQWFNKLFGDKEKSLEESVQTDLKALGLSKEEVAQSLSISNIKGKRGLPDSCPIAAYLRSKHPGVRFYVSPDRVECFYIRDNRFDYGRFVSNPPAIKCFVSLFDGGGFPELEEFNNVPVV